MKPTAQLVTVVFPVNVSGGVSGAGPGSPEPWEGAHEDSSYDKDFISKQFAKYDDHADDSPFEDTVIVPMALNDVSALDFDLRKIHAPHSHELAREVSLGDRYQDVDSSHASALNRREFISYDNGDNRQDQASGHRADLHHPSGGSSNSDRYDSSGILESVHDRSADHSDRDTRQADALTHSGRKEEENIRDTRYVDALSHSGRIDTQGSLENSQSQIENLRHGQPPDLLEEETETSGDRIASNIQTGQSIKHVTDIRGSEEEGNRDLSSNKESENSIESLMSDEVRTFESKKKEPVSRQLQYEKDNWLSDSSASAHKKLTSREEEGNYFQYRQGGHLEMYADEDDDAEEFSPPVPRSRLPRSHTGGYGHDGELETSIYDDDLNNLSRNPNIRDDHEQKDDHCYDGDDNDQKHLEDCQKDEKVISTESYIPDNDDSPELQERQVVDVHPEELLRGPQIEGSTGIKYPILNDMQEARQGTANQHTNIIEESLKRKGASRLQRGYSANSEGSTADPVEGATVTKNAPHILPPGDQEQDYSIADPQDLQARNMPTNTDTLIDRDVEMSDFSRSLYHVSGERAQKEAEQETNPESSSDSEVYRPNAVPQKENASKENIPPKQAARNTETYPFTNYCSKLHVLYYCLDMCHFQTSRH